MPGRILSKETEAKLLDAKNIIAAVLALLDKAEDGAASDEAKEALGALQEAANLGNWLESRIHLAFTQIADELFGNGQLNRTERITLSAAIGEALSSFNTSINANLPDIYARSPWSDATPDVESAVAEAAIDEEAIPLLERAIRPDGTIPMKLIEPGWGSSGYYPRDVLMRDGPKVFVKGTKSFWNHATPAEEALRPEGDLNALAAELVSDARFEVGPLGEGLYADAKVFGPYKSAVNELAPHIGVSIRATGKAVNGEAEGRSGKIITALTAGKSVDFVTQAGAGGAIVEMFEAARQRATSTNAAQVVDAASSNEEIENMVTEQQLNEAMTKIANVETENARLREALILRDARELARTTLEKTKLPAITQGRLLVQVTSGELPIKEGALDTAAFLEKVNAATTEEATYIAQVGGYGGGVVRGMGHTDAATGESATASATQTARLAESFQALGMSKEEAAIAANGI